MPLFSIVNIFVFQAAWFSAAILREQALWIMIPLLLAHLYFSPSRRADFTLLMYLLPLALVVEAILLFGNIVIYNSLWTLPIWMVLLWTHLILSCNHSLKWLQTTPIIWVVILGGLVGVSSYAAGSNFGSMKIVVPQLHNLVLIGVMWAIIMPVMSRVAKSVSRRVAQ